MTKQFKPGDKVVANTATTLRRYGTGPITVTGRSPCGRFVRVGLGEYNGWCDASFKAAQPATFGYADLQPGDVFRVTVELTVVERTSRNVKCVRKDGGAASLTPGSASTLNIELVSRKATPLTVGDTVRCTLTDKIGTLTGTSESKYAWVVFGNSTRPKTRLLAELVRHTAA